MGAKWREGVDPPTPPLLVPKGRRKTGGGRKKGADGTCETPFGAPTFRLTNIRSENEVLYIFFWFFFQICVGTTVTFF